MNPVQLEQLERLARLKADGAINDAEYAAAKAQLLAKADAPITPAATPAPWTSDPTHDDTRLSTTWQLRFRFLDEHGMPNTRTYKAAWRRVPMWSRNRIAFTGLGLILGPFYFLYLGLWRPALSLFAASLVYAAIVSAMGLPDTLDRVAWVIPAVFYAYTAIPLYYLKRRRGIHSWNPFVWRHA